MFLTRQKEGGGDGVVLVAGAAEAFAQGTFKSPLTLEAGGMKLPAGEYRVAQKDDGQITLR